MSLTKSFALHTLSSCTHGTETNRIPEHFGSMPLVVLLVLKCGHLLGVQLPDRGKVAVPSDECRTPKEVTMLGQTMGFGKLLSFCNDPFPVLTLHSAPLERQTHLQRVLHDVSSSLYRCWCGRPLALQLDLIQMLRSLQVCHDVLLSVCLAKVSILPPCFYSYILIAKTGSA